MTAVERVKPSSGIRRAGFEFTIYRGPGGLADLRLEWERHAAGLPDRRFFHLYVWHQAYVEALATDPESVYFVVARDGDTLRAIFPLELRSRRINGIPLVLWTLPFHPHFPQSDFIFEKRGDNSVLIVALVDFLKRGPYATWDMLRLPSLIEDTATHFLLTKTPIARRVSECIGASHFIRCGGANDPLARLGGSFRRNLRRLRRRAESLGRIDYRSCRAPEDLEAAFRQFLDVEASGWKGEHGQSTAIRCHPPTERFYRSLLRESGGSQQCVINLLSLNGECIAAQFGLLVEGVLSLLKIGFRASQADMAPGFLLLEDLFLDCAAGGSIHTVNFVTSPAWTHSWRPELMLVWKHSLFNTTWRGTLAYVWARMKPTHSGRSETEPMTPETRTQA